MKYPISVILFVIAVVTSAQAYTPVFESIDCPFFMTQLVEPYDATLSCGYLHVPEDRQNVAGSLQVELFVVRIHATQSSENAPFVFLEGGPGGAATVSLIDWLTSDLRQNYDIIIMDQRGTGLSRPSLNCADTEYMNEITIERCRKQLVDAGIDLNDYTSADNANDFHDLLVALDIPQANIYGSSYGVRLGLTMARDFPERIRALILDAVYPPQVDSLPTEAGYINQAFEQLFADCEASPTCNTAYPDLRQSFYTAIDNMNDDPPSIYDYDWGGWVVTTGDDFVERLFNLMYDTTILQFLPALIDAYAQGEYDYDPVIEYDESNFDTLLAANELEPDSYDLLAFEYLGIDDISELYEYYASLSEDEFNELFTEIEDYAYFAPIRDYLGLETIEEASDYLYRVLDEEVAEIELQALGYYDDDSEGMYYSVECAEEFPFYTPDDVLARVDDIPERLQPLIESSLEAFNECAIWNVEPAQAIENEPVISDIPTLILSGRYDPITPYQWGDDTRRYLPNSVHYIFPNVGHGALDLDNCATQIVLDFLETPMQQPDGQCVDELTPPDFYIRPDRQE